MMGPQGSASDDSVKLYAKWYLHHFYPLHKDWRINSSFIFFPNTRVNDTPVTKWMAQEV